MNRKSPAPASDQSLEQAKRILEDPSFSGDPLREHYQVLADAYGRVLRTFMKTIRISDGYQLRLKQLNAALDEAVRTDYLTGLLNRRAFFELIKTEASRSRRHERSLCILMADIDRFKLVNDNWGHDTGDRALGEAARIFSTSLRSEDLKVRWGGEEFLALLPETGLDGAAAAAEKLRAMFEATAINAGGRSILLTMSVGVAEGAAEDPDAVIRAADLALLEAKRTGRNKVVVAGPPTSSPATSSSPSP